MVNILIVEDNAELRKLMKIHISRAGYTVFEAGDGKEALLELEREMIHLMVIDLMMPNMNGYELTTELRSSGVDIPLLIVSAKESLNDKREGFRRGADDYMTKPVDFDEMLLRIEALLRRCGFTHFCTFERMQPIWHEL